MAILAHVGGLSMGNTCQLPVLTPEINGCAGSRGEIRRDHPSCQTCESFGVSRHPPLAIGRKERGTARTSADILLSWIRIAKC
jgi:hypothetical protein